MRNTFIAFLLSFFLLILLKPQIAEAEQKAAGSSATLSDSVVQTESDNRANILQRFLEQYHSPLAPFADTFIIEADKNQLDWKLLPAIAGVESYFGEQIPANSYNGWGWGVYGNNVHRFTSWDDAIKTIGDGIRTDYMNKWGAKDVFGIGRSYAADPSWAYKVNHFMDEIDKFATDSQNNSLSISI